MKRRAWVVWGGALVVGLAWGLGSLGALTSPISGATPKPAGLELSLPFERGTRVFVTAGYGPQGGSSFHINTNEAGRANDHYALDLTLPDHADGGLGQPVLAMAPGTVLKAGWATEGWSNYGQRVILRHDFSDDGHSYISHYAHLDSIAVSEGQRVERGQELGRLGGSCQGVIDCPNFGPHLHVALHQDASVGGSGTGGSYGGRAVVLEPLDGYEDLSAGQTLVSGNAGGGDPDQPCQRIGGGETILEDTGPCFRRAGPPQYWHDEGQGHGGHSVWTYTISDPDPDNSARWELYFEQGGEVEVEAYIPAAWGQSRQAKYLVRHEGRQEEVVRDQRSAPDGWLSLGSFRFAQGGDQWVSLADNTGEPYVSANDNTKIAFDALRLRPTTACACGPGDEEQEGCERCGSRRRSCDGCQWGGWGACAEQGECEPGAQEDQPCPDGTTHTRACEPSCRWTAWSECGEALDAGGPEDVGDPEDVGGSEDAGGPEDVSAPPDAQTDVREPQGDAPQGEAQADARSEGEGDPLGEAGEAPRDLRLKTQGSCSTQLGAPSAPSGWMWVCVGIFFLMWRNRNQAPWRLLGRPNIWNPMLTEGRTFHDVLK
jgi:hypothetical protein